MADPEPLRIGLLGAARISDMAVIQPSRITGDRLVAVAARHRARAEEYARVHGIERVVDDYQALIEDPEVEVIYNPLANGHHAPWNLRAIAAGKHVLSEKPFASNAEEAMTVRDAGLAAGVHVVEAFHYRYHPLQERLLEIAASGEIGDVVYVEARMLMPPPPAGDLRWDWDVAGGGLMDVGCYAVHGLRDLAALLGGDPVPVRARAGQLPAHPGIDAWLTADLEYPSGVPASIECSMTHGVLDFSFRIVGSNGEVYAPAFVLPHMDDRVIVTVGTEQRIEELGRRSSYTYMLEALRRLVRSGEPMVTDADDAVVTMRMIDDIYRSAGMLPRPLCPID